MIMVSAYLFNLNWFLLEVNKNLKGGFNEK